MFAERLEILSSPGGQADDAVQVVIAHLTCHFSGVVDEARRGLAGEAVKQVLLRRLDDGRDRIQTARWAGVSEHKGLKRALNGEFADLIVFCALMLPNAGEITVRGFFEGRFQRALPVAARVFGETSGIYTTLGFECQSLPPWYEIILFCRRILRKQITLPPLIHL